MDIASKNDSANDAGCNCSLAAIGYFLESKNKTITKTIRVALNFIPDSPPYGKAGILSLNIQSLRKGVRVRICLVENQVRWTTRDKKCFLGYAYRLVS